MAKHPTPPGVIRALATALLAALAACGAPTPGDSLPFDPSTGLNRVKAARSELSTAQVELAVARAGLADGPGGPAAPARSPAEQARLAQRLEQAQARYDAAYRADQAALAAFLNVALNRWPEAPQTREALGLYTESALANAAVLVADNGDYAGAVALLETATGYFGAIRAPVPVALARALEAARSFRYLSHDRFARVTVGMTEAAVRAITGTPYYANVRESSGRGGTIVTWRFARADGGVAAIDFSRGLVSGSRWDAEGSR